MQRHDDLGYTEYHPNEDWWQEDRATALLREVGEPKSRFIRLTDEEALAVLYRTGVLKEKNDG